jgi:hypothetical protein
MPEVAADFYAAIPVIGNFAEAVRAQSYRPLPDDWIIGFSDVAGSTQAVAEGRYKAVNLIGAGVIAAVSNALARKEFPFVFGGDGASFAVGPADARAATEALKAARIARRHGFRRRDSRGGPGCARRALRRISALRLCDVRRRRAELVREPRQARRLRA